jgi:Pyridoxamine 5'-phosphate oxidase
MTTVLSYENLDRYGGPGFHWSDILERLEGNRIDQYWLATVRADGRPHLAGIGARWLDGRLYFTSGARTQKSKNLEQRNDCVIAAHLSGLDLTFEGIARRVTDRATVERLAELYATTGWPARAGEGALVADYSAPSAGLPPWDLWAMSPTSAVGVGEAGATRWRFGS